MSQLSFSDLRRTIIATLERAADTLRRLPIPLNGRPSLPQSAWPDLPETGAVAPLPPRARSVDELDRVLPWLNGLNTEERQLVWARAAGVPWTRLSRDTGMRVGALRHRWNGAIDRIVARAVHDSLSEVSHRESRRSGRRGTWA
jgi:hypothetical protein